MSEPQDYELVKHYYVKSDHLPADINQNGLYFIEKTGQIYLGTQLFGGRVLIDTTANWNSTPTLKSVRGTVYVYSDHHDLNGTLIPGLKVGDGTSYLIDMPFIEDYYQDHVDNSVIHVTQQDKDNWNNKVRCYVDDNVPGKLIFTTH